MCKSMNRKTLGPALCIMLAAGTASANQPYVGIALGKGSFSDWCSVDHGRCKDTDTGLKMFGGIQFNQNFAVELSYFSFGTMTDNTVPAVDMTALGVSAVGMIPVGAQFNLLGKAGVARWSGSGPAAIGGEDNGISLSYGVGGQYNVSEKVAIRGEWEQVDTGEPLIGKLSLLSASFIFKL